LAPKVTDKERAEIVAYLEDEKSHGWISGEVGRSKDTIRRIANASGLNRSSESVKKAGAMQSAYAEARRLEIIGKGFDKANDLLENITDASELQKWSVALGTLVDKARLETGQATDRTESVDPERRKRIHGTVDELDVLRRLRSGNTG